MAKPHRLKSLLNFLIPFLVFLLAALILFNNYSKPLYGHHDWNGVFYGQIARNYLQLDLAATKLGQVTSSGLNQTQPSFYTHYPPLLPLSLAFSYRLFGISALSTRLVPILFSAAAILVLFQIAQTLKFSLLASLAAVIVVLTPMYRYFGKMPDQEAPLIFFTLLSLLYYLKLLNKPSQKLQFKFYLSVVLNGLTAWAGYFLYPLLALHSYFFHKKTFQTALKAVYLLIIIFLLHLTHTYLLTGSFTGGGLIQALLLRLNIYHLQGQPDPSSRQFTLPAYLTQQARWLTVYYTRPLLLTGLAFLGFTTAKIIKKTKLTHQQLIIFLLFLWSLAYPIIFSNVVFIHEYFNFFFLPFLGLSLAWLIDLIRSQHRFAAIIAFILLTAFIYQERLSFYHALEATQAHRPGFELGRLIHDLLSPTDSALVFASSDYLGVQEPFITFYANRAVSFANYDQTDWLETQANLSPPTHVFTVVSDQSTLFIDQALATQSAIIKSFTDFNYYQLSP